MSQKRKKSTLHRRHKFVEPRVLSRFEEQMTVMIFKMREVDIELRELRALFMDSKELVNLMGQLRLASPQILQMAEAVGFIQRRLHEIEIEVSHVRNPTRPL